jgi:hypothetical protein
MNKKNNQKTIQPHQIHLYFNIKKQEKKLNAFSCFH